MALASDFDPTAATSGSSDFPGTGTNAIYGVGSDLAVYPVILKGRTSPPPGTEDFTAHQAAGAEKVVPLESALALLYKMGSTQPDRLLSLQDELVNAGVLKAGKYTPGVVDEDTFNAYQTIVLRAARAGRPIDDMLTEAVTATKAAGGANRSAKGPLTVQLTNPDDLRAVIQAGAAKVYGHSKIDPADIEKIIAGYQSQESAAQTAAYNDAGSVVAPPNPSSYVEGQLRSLHPNEAAATDFNNQADAFMKGLGNARSGGV